MDTGNRGRDAPVFLTLYIEKEKIQMKRLQELTEEQRIFAEKNHALVECFLRKNGLDRAEFYDVVIFGYLAAVQEYLEEPELSGYRFSSIAWVKMKDCMLREFHAQSRPKRKAFTGVYHEEYSCEVWSRQEVSRIDSLPEEVDNQQRIRYLSSYMTPKEKEVVCMRAAGYSYREIADLCHITIRGVSARLERMRRRFRSLALV